MASQLIAAIVGCAVVAAARRPLAYFDPNNPTGIQQGATGGGTIRGVSGAGNIPFGGDFNNRSPPHYPGLAGKSEGKGSSQGIGDPILKGFDGRNFEFFGKVGGHYNLLSEANHQLSVRLKFAHMWDHNGTYMDAFSLSYRGHQVTATLNEADTLSVALDGRPLELQPGQEDAEELLGLLQGELHILLQAHRRSVGNALELTTELLNVLIYVTPAGLLDEGGVEQPAYLNFDLQLLEEAAKMEGIVGHTYNPDGEGVADKDDFEFHHAAEDYELASFSALGEEHVLYSAPEPLTA